MRSKHPIFIVLGLGLAALACGCQSARVDKPVVAELNGNDPDIQINFWHTLASRPLTSNDDALHGMLLYLDDKDDCATYSDRMTTLKRRGLLPAGFDEPANDSVRRGTVAVMFVKVLGLRGGWAMHLLGPTPRYAVRELQYLSIFPYSSPQQTFNGTEFVGVIGALEDYQKSHPQSHGAMRAPPSTSSAQIGPVDASASRDLRS